MKHKKRRKKVFPKWMTTGHKDFLKEHVQQVVKKILQTNTENIREKARERLKDEAERKGEKGKKIRTVWKEVVSELIEEETWRFEEKVEQKYPNMPKTRKKNITKLFNKNLKKRANVFIDIFNNTFYSQFIILISLGEDTLKKLENFKTKYEGIKPAPGNLSNQVRMLVDKGYVEEDDVSGLRGKKKFTLVKGTLFKLFMQRLGEKHKQKRLKEKQAQARRKNKKQKAKRKKVKKPWIMDEDTIIELQMEQLDEKQRKELAEQRKITPEYILKSSDAFQGFIEKSILDYFKEEFEKDPNKLLANPLGYHFDAITKDFFLAKYCAFFVLDDNLLTHEAKLRFDMKKKIDREMFAFLELCERLEGYDTERKYSTMFKIMGYLGK